MITQHQHPAPSAAAPERRTVCGTVCEVYSRVCGYFRPVAAWNKGKKEEFKERKVYTGTLPRLAAVLLLFAVMILIAGCHNTIDTDKTTYYNASGGIDRVVEKECKSEMPTTYKSIDMQSDVNAVSASIIDAKTGNFSPYLDLGFFKLKYVSYPVIPGQPYFIERKEYSTSWLNWVSFFSTSKQDTKENIVAETTMWIGNVPANGKNLTVTTKTGTGLRISGDGFETDRIKVKMETSPPSNQ